MKLLPLTLFFALTCVIGSVAGAERTPVVELDHVLVVVNDDVITQSELNAEIATISAQLRQQNTALPPADMLNKQVLERLILKRLQLQLAGSIGIRVDDDTLNRAISTIAQQNKLSLAEFRDVLEKDGFSFPVFRERIREEIIINRLRQRQVDSRVTVTEQEVDNFLSNRQRQSTEGAEEYRVAQILIALPEAASPEQIDKARQKAGEVLKKLRAGADFSETAVAVSDDQQALQGGDLGWRTASQLPTLFADLTIKMQPGEISEPLRSPSGFHIIKLIEKRGETAHIVQQTQARHILIRTNEITADSDAQTRLQQLKQRIEGGDDFAALATSHSEDPATAVNGGSLGWVSPGDVDTQFEEVMHSLKPGEVSAPFQTQFGWHILQVLDRREHDSTREFNRSKAREAIRNRKIEEQTQAWLRALRDEAYVEYKTEDE
ncbi:MAG: molecular chaperone SurA [Gammaproteobacteria bacterium]|nr:MAG: molecular chaperone SurA [Gammaproteobacteria bacterium]